MMSAPTGYSYSSYGNHIHGPQPLSHHHEFVPAIHEQHIYLPSHHGEEDEHPVYYNKGKGHDLSIKDFFEIALTALAFLAFGLFIIQLLMNITASNSVKALYIFIAGFFVKTYYY
jgi:hypothetical protein